MARTKTNLILHELSGHIGKQILVKHYPYGTVISKYPNRENIVFSEGQEKSQGVFSEAVHYAQAIINNPAKKAAYKATLPTGKSVYHAAIKEYMSNHKPS